MPNEINVEQLRRLRLQRFSTPGTTQSSSAVGCSASKSPPLSPKAFIETAGAESKAEEIEDLFVRDEITTNYFVHPVICSDHHVYDGIELLKRKVPSSYHTREPLEMLAPDRTRRNYSHSVPQGHQDREAQYNTFVAEQKEAVRSCPPPPAPQDIEHQISLAPHDPVLRLQRAEELLGKKEYHRALLDFEKVLFMAPGAPRALIGRTACLAATGCEQSRLHQLNLQIQQEPTAALYSERGFINDELCNYASAATDFEQAIALDPMNYLAKEGLAAICLFDFFEPERALQQISEVLNSNSASAYSRLIDNMSKYFLSDLSFREEYQIYKKMDLEFLRLTDDRCRTKAAGFLRLMYETVVLDQSPIPKEIDQLVNKLISYDKIYASLVPEEGRMFEPYVAESIYEASQGRYSEARALASAAETRSEEFERSLNNFIYELRTTKPRDRVSLEKKGGIVSSIGSRVRRHLGRGR
jgi:tetratricopeptide (TPR) repeat protein